MAKVPVSAQEQSGEISAVDIPPGKPDYNVYTYQQQTMPVLLGWGIGSVAAGLVWMRSTADRLRGLGSQFTAWGAVDSLIAALAIRNATHKSGLVELGEIPPAEHRRQAISFERIVWLNALLDIGYIAGGISMAKRNPGNQRKQGMGWGITIQGAFLLIWDVLLASLAWRARRDP